MAGTRDQRTAMDHAKLIEVWDGDVGRFWGKSKTPTRA